MKWYEITFQQLTSPADELEGGSWLVEGRSDSSDAWTDSSSCWLSISRPASEVILEEEEGEEKHLSVFR